jgi:SAUR family protein
MITKGCATFWVGEERFAVPVTLLGHPRILELLVEAEEKYGYAHEGAVVVPCGVQRFQKAVDAARAQERHRHHHHHHFRLPHLAACFRPSHVVAYDRRAASS